MSGSNTTIFPCRPLSNLSIQLISLISSFKNKLLLLFYINLSMKKYCCNQCDLEFSYPSLLQRHHRIHTKQKLFQCPSCPKTFIRADTLKTHMNIHSNRGFRCCGKTLHSRASLKYHIKTYHILKCPTCEKHISNTKELYEHIEEHEMSRVKMEVETSGSVQPQVKEEFVQ